MAETRKQPRTLVRRLGFALATLLFVIIALLAVRLAPLFLTPNDYADVPSIEKSAAYRDPVLLETAWSLPVARRYRRLPFEFQRNQSVCGPASVANVLHSLGDASSQELVLASSPKRTWFGYLIGGLTLDELGGLLSRRSGRSVSILRDLNAEQFRAAMRLVNDPRHRMIINFHRGPLFGRGHGHISPVLAYLGHVDKGQPQQC